MAVLTIDGRGYGLDWTELIGPASGGGPNGRTVQCYRVTTPEGVAYAVNAALDRCTCPDFLYRKHECKHLSALKTFLEGKNVSAPSNVASEPEAKATETPEFPAAGRTPKQVRTREVEPPPALELTLQETERLAEQAAKSAYFADTRTASQALVKILVGREMGFSAMASIMGIHIVEGKPMVGAHLLAAAIRRSGKYGYEILEHTDKACRILFTEGKKKLGASVFTFQEAVDTGIAVARNGEIKSNWAKSPRNMLFARALSNGYRFFTPDAIAMPAYVVGELEDPEDLDPAEAKALAAVSTATPQEPAKADTPAPNGEASSPADPSKRISDAQASELATLIRERGIRWESLFAHYQIRTLSQLPLIHYQHCKDRLLSKPAKANGNEAGTAKAAAAS